MSAASKECSAPTFTRYVTPEHHTRSCRPQTLAHSIHLPPLQDWERFCRRHSKSSSELSPHASMLPCCCCYCCSPSAAAAGVACLRPSPRWCDLLPLKKLSVGQGPRLCNLPSKSYSKINVPYTSGDDLVKESRQSV